MSALVIVDVRITDAAKFEEYRKRVPATLAPYGGKFLARGGRIERLEGDWDPQRIVVLEFPTLERAKAWWASEEYRLPKRMRAESAETRMIAVESV
ncbi:hypothetical protein SVA_1816 [Sulfurifustis variabilis]|uniref:DUF1330 domain-containing protein n=1 Tax=Sulfurifustis variabilis TaxID=1675686 RepID=A0A1B4V4C7_9GAMM|nr:DUF1330 domain-containing protein [Sulfurifustis variabilis]BAU48370.1 hypothetical protein SVA_1816 [Sulfurifustis variabilis]